MHRSIDALHGSRSARLERAASLVEYALLVALIALACLAAVQFLGQATDASFTSSSSSIAGT